MILVDMYDDGGMKKLEERGRMLVFFKYPDLISSDSLGKTLQLHHS